MEFLPSPHQTLSLTKPLIMKHILTTAAAALLMLLSLNSCRKDLNETPGTSAVVAGAKPDRGHLQQTKTFSSEVARKWQELQLRILRIAGTNIYGMNGNRNFAYTGIALYEAVLPGMPAYQSLSGQLSAMPAMPTAEPGRAYHWAASANAALAFLNKNFYTTASSANIAAMDSLENAFNTQYQAETTPEVFERSVNFGRTVAQRVFEWSRSDGSLATYPPYTAPAGVGLWSPTAPNPTAVFAPYWGHNRLFVPGSLNGTASPPPPPYSTDPNSAYYQMVKEVYDISQTLTPQQAATALYFRDNPGFQAGTHYIAIFHQVMQQETPSLDLYALAHAKTGIAIAESQIGCWKMKYEMVVDRPVRYIRQVLGHSSWSPLLSTPPHPEYPSGHSQTGGAFATAMSSLFGSNYNITLRTYDNLGMAPRTYTSFDEMVDDIGRSRVYAGIHYTYTCVESAKQGNRIATNILNRLKFLKE